jgi:hypothetical protein
VETLGPLTKVTPGKTVELVEYWGLFRNVKVTSLTDDELDRTILPLVEAVRSNE